ncbi:MAG: 16S rRNA (cytosine(1402)-N(4))-methyltransferase RsmH [Chloroflexota bacterium]
MTSPPAHTPVLLAESLRFLDPRPGGRFIDCTVGLGGHAEALLTAVGPSGRLLALDADPDALERARQRLSGFDDRVALAHSNFEHLLNIAEVQEFQDVDGVLLDLGVSSLQFGPSGRGFTIRESEPLDMRMDPTRGPTAAELLASLPEHELADIIFQYGEDRASRRIARSIVYHRDRRPITTTDDLVGAVISAVGGQRGRIHPATRTFQALRIAVNRELDVLSAALEQATMLLRPGGRLVVISFHSLEDRIVKRFLLESAADDAARPLDILTRKPITPSEAEISVNPRSRSAKLRAGQRVMERDQPRHKEQVPWP